MAWTSPFTWIADKIVSAYQLRTHIVNNLAYLYSSRPAAITQSADLKAAATRDKGVVYRNTDDKARLCCVVVLCANTPYSLDATVECEGVTPPTTFVVISSFSSGSSNNAFGVLYFIVPVNYYYKVEVLSNGVGAGVSRWFEWSM